MIGQGSSNSYNRPLSYAGDTSNSQQHVQSERQLHLWYCGNAAKLYETPLLQVLN